MFAHIAFARTIRPCSGPAPVTRDMSSTSIRPAPVALALLLALAACAAPRTVGAPAPMAPVSALVTAPPAAVGMSPALAQELDSIVAAAIADRASPGVAIAIGRHGRLVVNDAWGRTDWAQEAAAVTDSTIYDMASLTKVVATTTAAMLLEEDGLLDIERTVASYLPEFD